MNTKVIICKLNEEIEPYNLRIKKEADALVASYMAMCKRNKLELDEDYKGMEINAHNINHYWILRQPLIEQRAIEVHELYKMMNKPKPEREMTELEKALHEADNMGIHVKDLEE